MIKLYKKTVPVLLFLLCLLIPLGVSAADPRDDMVSGGSITIRHTDGDIALADVPFSVYMVAHTLDSNELEILPAFADYPVNWDLQDTGAWRTLAGTLEAYVRRDRPDVICQPSTDQNGIACIQDLSSGLYLIVGEAANLGGCTYTPEPMLVMLPYRDHTYTVQHDAFVETKSDIVPLEEQENIVLSVVKIWNDRGKEASRPTAIVVELLRDGDVYRTVELNASTNWRFTWPDLDAAFTWRVTEKDVPAGYTVKIEQDTSTYILTNTAAPSDTPVSDPPKLPYTGMLQWPVFVLAFVGVWMLLTGILLRKGLDHHET